MSAIQASAGYSVLKAANKQPELALQLLLQTLQPAPATAETRATTVQPAAQAGSGQIIDIVA